MEAGAVADGVLRHLRAACLALPDAVEEQAWVGTRWRVRGKTFAHVLVVRDGWPPAYARAAATDGPATVLTFRATEPDLGVLRGSGPPFFAPVWRADEVGVVLGARVGRHEVAELVTDSYCALAPKTLRARVSRPDD
jgi:hypothetical protein